MMLKPSIDRLLEKVNSKYSLVILSSKRAHELEEGTEPTIENFESVKSVGRALEEIEHGKVEIDPNPELKRELKKIKAEELNQKREQEQKELEEKVINKKI